MLKFAFLALWLYFGKSSASKCESLEGKWYNQLGSELILTRNAKGHLIGEYRTGVEREPGAAGSSHSIVRGVASPAAPGAVIGFTVIFNGGKSTASWTGQCMICGNEEMLETTWLLRKAVPKCLDKWQSTLVGRDTFTRHEHIEGPRKENNKHVPERLEEWEKLGREKEAKRELESEGNDNERNRLKHLTGKWHSATGSELELLPESNGRIIGSYSRHVNSYREMEGEVVGFVDPSNPNATFGFTVLITKSDAATVWVGQYHKCKDGREVIETSWLRHTKIHKCDHTWKSTHFGTDTFTRDRPEVAADEETPFFSRMGNAIRKAYSKVKSWIW